MAHRPKRLDGSYALMVAGPGVPAGGLEGQFLKKNTDVDYDTVWVRVGFINLSGLPSDNDALDEVLSQKSDISHTHDTRYYKEDEIDAFLAAQLILINARAPMLLVPTEITDATYATTTDDNYVAKLCTNVAQTVITLNNQAPIGARVRVKAMTAAGFTFVAGVGMTVLSESDAYTSPGQYAVAEAWRINATQWSILGQVEA